jgi:hypothetical protein
MNKYEARLNAMLVSESATWNLNGDDKEAIQWAFARIKTLEDDIKRSDSQRADAVNHLVKYRDRMSEIVTLANKEIS